MKLLSICKDDEIVLSISNITLLYGHSDKWFYITESIKDFFTNRNTDVQISLDSIDINKKDWECLFLSLKDGISFTDKITMKSPVYAKLSELLAECSETPEYINFQNSWDDLCNLLFFKFSDQMQKTDLDLFLEYEEIPISALIGALRISAHTSLSPLEQKMILLKWFLCAKQEKRRLIIFEYPEIYSNIKQLLALENFIHHFLSEETYFIIVSDYNFKSCIKNIIVDDKIINSYYLGLFYNDAVEHVPCVFNETEFNNASDVIMNWWHKDVFYTLFNALSVKEQYIATFLCKRLKFVLNERFIKIAELANYYKNYN